MNDEQKKLMRSLYVNNQTYYDMNLSFVRRGYNLE